MRPLRQLLYLSRAAITLTDHDVRQILWISQRNNRQKDVTGCLLYSGRHFAQVLEGEPVAIEALVERIANDSRHNGFAVVMDHEVSMRRFPDWSMGVLYSLDFADRLESFLADGHVPEVTALTLLSELRPDAVMGTL